MRGPSGRQRLRSREGAAILATIVNKGGQPVRHAYLYAAYVSDEFGKGPKEFVASGDDGTFEIEHLPEGAYSFSHSRLDSALARVKLAAGGHERVRIEVNPVDEHGYLRVLIVTEAGVPLATPDVWLERGGRVVEPVYNNDDTTAFGAAPGTYTLCVHAPGFRSVRQRIELRGREGRTMQEIFSPMVVTMRNE